MRWLKHVSMSNHSFSCVFCALVVVLIQPLSIVIHENETGETNEINETLFFKSRTYNSLTLQFERF